MKLLTFFATLATILLLAVSTGATAHTGMASSAPADGEVLHHSPEQVQLMFGSPVRLIKLDVTTADGQPVDLGDYRGGEATATITAPLPELAPGTYQVKWTVMGGDAHKMSGSFSFTLSGH